MCEEEGLVGYGRFWAGGGVPTGGVVPMELLWASLWGLGGGVPTGGVVPTELWASL